jgi:hypothetical protein
MDAARPDNMDAVDFQRIGASVRMGLAPHADWDKDFYLRMVMGRDDLTHRETGEKSVVQVIGKLGVLENGGALQKEIISILHNFRKYSNITTDYANILQELKKK